MDYTKECWFCGKKALVPKGTYYQCSECGATWNEVPVCHFNGLVIEPVDSHTRDTKYRPYRRRSRAKA